MTDSNNTPIHDGDTIASPRVNGGVASQPVKHAGDLLCFQCGKGEFYLSQETIVGDGWVKVEVKP